MLAALMGSIVLVRHATTTASQAGTNLGQRRDPGLTADGLLLAERLGRAIALELAELDQTELRLISSPARRCLETAAGHPGGASIRRAPGGPGGDRLCVRSTTAPGRASRRRSAGGAIRSCAQPGRPTRSPRQLPAASPAATSRLAPSRYCRRFEDWLAADRSSAAVVVSHNHVLRLRLAALIGFAMRRLSASAGGGAGLVQHRHDRVGPAHDPSCRGPAARRVASGVTKGWNGDLEGVAPIMRSPSGPDAGDSAASPEQPEVPCRSS